MDKKWPVVPVSAMAVGGKGLDVGSVFMEGGPSFGGKMLSTTLLLFWTINKLGFPLVHSLPFLGIGFHTVFSPLRFKM